MPSVISGDANVSATEFGFLDGVTSSLQSQIDSKLPLAGGKILQIVRATDTTTRTITSLSDVDVTGMSVTITPQKSDSAIVIIMNASVRVDSSTTDALRARVSITDASNNYVSGAQQVYYGTFNITGTSTREIETPLSLFGYSTPATTSAVTYKVRSRLNASGSSVHFRNDTTTGQLYAIEVSA